METMPQTLMDAVRYFADVERTHELAVQMRWPEGVHCPTCGRADVRFIATRRVWECKEKHAKRQFTVKKGTIFEDSPLSLDKWFVAIWSVANCKNGISSYELARAIGVTQKTGWHMLHRIRLAMEAGSLDKLDGTVEADETYIGGKLEFMHKVRRERIGGKSGPMGKEVVVGVLERSTETKNSKVRARHIRDGNAKNIQGFVREHVEPGSELMTDSARSYQKLRAEYVHDTVNHHIEYVRGAVHTNGIENFWSLLKRTVRGTYVSVDAVHLFRYLGEQAFRFNERKDNDFGRFAKVLGSVAGKQLTYKELTGHAEA